MTENVEDVELGMTEQKDATASLKGHMLLESKHVAAQVLNLIYSTFISSWHKLSTEKKYSKHKFFHNNLQPSGLNKLKDVLISRLFI